ncbi:M23 family metallopeptidase [Salmonella enterica subsp. enterica]|nr:M23 family metallopeptidase [Salmonella enterica subsp. enterica serovar Baguida]
MIISPPLLHEHSDTEKDADWVSRMMPVDHQRNFPVNTGHSWHGGIHLSSNSSDPIRCIADGKVISLRQPDSAKSNIPPLNYNGITDCGYILLKHETEIGSGDEGKIIYYSLYMHLSNVDNGVQPGKMMYRKDVIGTTGMVDNQHAIHFQIFCDDDNIAKITGRRTPELDFTKNGRTDVVYGDIHFYIPAGAAVYEIMPGGGTLATNGPVKYTNMDLFVTMSFDKGSCTMVTRKADGHYSAIGEPLVNADGADYEYNLYTYAKSFYPLSPSAGYELLRFGRVINTEYEVLSPVDAPLWRTINVPDGKGVVNLADRNVKVFSDGDFPHWTGWRLVDDDTDSNSQCNSPTILCTLDSDLSRMICHFPLEWDEGTVDSRFEWLKSPNDVLSKPMTECDLNLLTDHGKALCLAENPLPSGRIWHFEPREFIAHFRKCGWLNKKEMRQLIPLEYISEGQCHNIKDNYGKNSVFAEHYVSINKMARKYLINTPLRMACFFGNAIQETAWLTTTHEYYLYSDRDPRTHAVIGHHNVWYYPWYGRGFLQLTGPGNYYKYFSYRGLQYDKDVKKRLSDEYNRLYRNSRIRYTEDNHLGDANYPGLTSEVISYRGAIENGNFESADSAGFYWSMTGMAKYADVAHVLDRQMTITHRGNKIYYRSPSFWEASAIVNLPARINNLYDSGLNGFVERCCVYGCAIALLTELKFPDESGSYVLEYPENIQLRR